MAFLHVKRVCFLLAISYKRSKIQIKNKCSYFGGGSMSRIPNEALVVLETVIYLPMVLSIFERDCKAFEQGTFKLKRPYIDLVHEAMKQVQSELHAAHQYLQKNRLKIMRGNRDELFSEYIFIYNNNEEHRRYSNIRLRNRVEELLSIYLTQVQFKKEKDV